MPPAARGGADDRRSAARGSSAAGRSGSTSQAGRGDPGRAPATVEARALARHRGDPRARDARELHPVGPAGSGRCTARGHCLRLRGHGRRYPPALRTRPAPSRGAVGPSRAPVPVVRRARALSPRLARLSRRPRRAEVLSPRRRPPRLVPQRLCRLRRLPHGRPADLPGRDVGRDRRARRRQPREVGCLDLPRRIGGGPQGHHLERQRPHLCPRLRRGGRGVCAPASSATAPWPSARRSSASPAVRASSTTRSPSPSIIATGPRWQLCPGGRVLHQEATD